MTDRIDALRALEKAVEAAAIDGMTPHCDLPAIHVLGAYYGSLDAAKALHEALLPGWRMDALWQGGVLCENDDDWSCRLRCVFGKSRVVENDERAAIPSPARAWLLAIIRALIAQEGGE